MFCKYCGTQIPDGAAFCPACGQPQQPQQPQQPVMTRQAPQPVHQPYATTQPVYTQQQPYANSQPVYAAPQQPVNVYVNNPAPARPVAQLRTNRALWKAILLSILTLGIYGLVMMCHIGEDMNTVASRYDGKKTMHYALLIFIIAPITLGIGAIVWIHKLCARMGNELTRRGIGYKMGASTFWLWGVLGSLILIGPFVFTHKLLKSMNLLNADYNARG